MHSGTLPTRCRSSSPATVQTSLDDKDLDPESILAVEARDGITIIADIDEAGRSAVRDRLYTTGELLRIDQLQPNLDSIDAAKVK